jgi:hypothetical protein
MRVQAKPLAKKLTLHGVQRRFQYWRKVRKKRNPLPEKLWNAAVTLCSEYTVNQVAAALQLNHTALSRRTAASHAESAANPVGPDASRFIELTLDRPAAPGEIEVNDPKGWKMIIRGARLGELLTAAHRIWDGRR